MVVLEKTGPVGDALPVETGRPSRHLDLAAPKLDGEERLHELPVLEAGGGPDFLKEVEG